MRFLRNAFDSLKPHFQKGERYEKYAPALNAFDTIFFSPNHTTPSRGAHLRDASDLKRVMVTVILAMTPVLLFGIYNVGYQSLSQMGEAFSFGEAFGLGVWRVLPMLAVSYGVGLAIEFVFSIWRGHEVNEGYLVTGMLIPLVLPPDLPLWMLAFAVAFAVVVGKEVFGGTGMNILNPALTARAFLFFAYPSYMSGDKVWVLGSDVDGVSGETVLGHLARKSSDFSYEVSDMVTGFIPGSIGETSVLAILLGALWLIFSGVGSWKIMLSSIVGASVMGVMFNAFGAQGNALMQFPWWQHLLVGGFAFGVVFMATDPVSAVQTERGKWIYGFLVGVLSILIRVFNPAYPEGVMMAILLMNVFAPLIDHYVIRNHVSYRKRFSGKIKLLNGLVR